MAPPVGGGSTVGAHDAPSDSALPMGDVTDLHVLLITDH